MRRNWEPKDIKESYGHVHRAERVNQSTNYMKQSREWRMRINNEETTITYGKKK